MRRPLILLCIVAQALVLAYMAVGRELILANGQRFYLRTAPIDPRDLFRGDFVRLSYEINSVPSKDFRGSVDEHIDKKGHPVYAVLDERPGGLHELAYLSDERPSKDIFLKGRITDIWRFRRSGNAAVKYGIEQLFVEQGSGLDIEKRRGGRGEMQIPMEVEIAVSPGGTAVLRDFRWSKLGIKLELLRINQRNRNNDEDTPEEEIPLSPKVKVSLQNVSQTSLVIVNPGQDCGFELTPTTWVSKDYVPADNSCSDVYNPGQGLFTLDPQQQYSVELDLAEPRWFMQTKDAKSKLAVGEIGEIAENEMFRIVYQSPSLTPIPDQATGRSIWLGELPSQAFNARGRID